MRKGDYTWAVAALLLGLLGGTAAVLLPAVGIEVLVTVLGLLLLVSAVVRRVGLAVMELPALALAVSSALVACDALRHGSATFGDIGILVALGTGVVLSPAIARRLYLVPTWLLVGTGALVVAILLSHMFPPSTVPLRIQEGLFRVRNSAGLPSRLSATTVASQLVFALFVFPVVMILLFDSARRIRLATSVWLGGVAVSAGVTVLQAFAGIDLEKVLLHHVYSFNSSQLGSARYTGLAVHPVQMGVSAAMAAPVALARIQSVRSWRPILLAGLCAMGVLLSGTRAALLGLLFAYLVVVTLRKQVRRPLLVLAVAALGVVILGGLGSTSALSRFVGSASSSHSAAGSTVAHAGQVALGIRAALERPLTGWGFQAIKGAHDVPLQLATSGGLLALSGYLVVLLGALTTGVRVARFRPEVVGLVGSLSAFIITGAVSNAISDRFLYIPIGLIGAWAVLERRRRPEPVGGLSVSASTEEPAASALSLDRAAETAGMPARLRTG